MLSIAIDKAPPGFQQPGLIRNVRTVFDLTPLASTRRVSVAGYGSGAGHDRIHALFERGNSFSLGKLRERVVSGPIGSLALALHEPAPPVHALLARNSGKWTQAIERCLEDAGKRLPKRTDWLGRRAPYWSASGGWPR